MVLGMCADNFSYRGCYSASALQSRLISMGTYMYQSVTYCQERCSGHAIAALLGGNECFCGDSLSILDGVYPTGGEECSVDCAGWPFVKCGGTAAMDVYVNDDFHASDDDNRNNNNNNNGDDGAAAQYAGIITRSLLQESMFEQHTDTSEPITHPDDTNNDDNHHPAVEPTTTAPRLPPLTVTEEKTMVLTPETSVRTVFVTLTPSPVTYAVTETTVEITPIVIPIVSSVGFTRTVFTSLLYTISNRVPTTIVMTSTVVFQQQPITSYIYSTLTRNEELTKYSILIADGTTMTKLVTSTYTYPVSATTASLSLSMETSRGGTVTFGSTTDSNSTSSSTRYPVAFVNTTRSGIAMVTTAGRGFSITSLASSTIVSKESNGTFSSTSNGSTGEFSPYNRSTSGSHGLSGGAIAGIVIGCVFGTVLVLSLLLFLFLLKKRVYSRRMQRLNLGNEETKYYQPYSFGINDSTQPPMVPFSMLTPRGSRSLSPRAASNHSNFSRGLHMHNPLIAMSTGGEHLNRAGSNGVAGGVADISKNTSAGSGNNATFADVVRANLLPSSFYHGENLTSVTSFPDMGMENRLHIVNPDNPNDALSSDGNKEDDIDIDSNSSI